MMNESKLEHLATAYHEAGHAVVSWWHGLPVVKVSVNGSSGTMEHVKGLRLRYSTADWLLLNAAVGAGGPVAELLLLRRRRRSGVRLATQPCDGDCRAWLAKNRRTRDAANIFGHAATDDDAVLLMGVIWNDLARPEVWRIVRGLAEALLRRRRLAGSELAVFRRAVENVGKQTELEAV